VAPTEARVSAKPSAEQGLQWLTEQIDRMSELRNCNTRDPGFREWRQNTLTVLQRIWPGQAGRAQRFRRVPFTPPSARASEQEARECFERGFAEARKLMKMWEAELKHVGTEGVDAEGENAGAQPAPIGNAESAPDVPIVSLPRASKTHAAPSTKARRPKDQLRDMLGFGDWGGDSAPGAAAQSGSAEAKSVRRAVAKATHAAAPKTSPSASRRKSHDAVRSTPSDALGQSIADALEHARSGEQEPAESSDLLIRPGFEDPDAPAATPAGPSAMRHAPASDHEPSREFLALVSELERLGVPRDELTRVGLALAEFGAHLDQGPVSWEAFREVMAMVMPYPGLARRAVPLLVRHFEAAA
jgi:hypothetical protein